MKINSLLDLKIFIWVAETESFTEAAELSGLSRSAVGKIIAKLEESLQHRLFHRTTRVVKLSYEGEIFLEHAKRILKEVEETEQVLSVDQEPQGRLKITVPVVFGRLHVMPLLWKFQQCYSQLAIEVLFSDEYQDVVREGIDIAIRIGGNSDSALIQKTLAFHQYLTCASSEYLSQNPALTEVSSIKKHQCLRYLHEGKAVSWKYQVNQEVVDIEPSGNMMLQDIESLKEAAIAGHGIVQLSSFLLRKSIESGDLQEVLPAFRPQKEPIYAVYPSKKYLSPKVRKLIDFIDNEWQRRLI